MARSALLVGIAVVALSGCAGDPGPQGPEGPRGPAGNDGTSLTIVQLSVGNDHCPTGGIQVTAPAGDVSYVCNGTPGQTGQTGGGWYTSHDDVYCNEVTGATSTNNWRLTASCDSSTDLGLVGSCAGVTAAGIYLSENGPSEWDTADFRAEWNCSWRTAGYGIPSDPLPNATATICCIKHP